MVNKILGPYQYSSFVISFRTNLKQNLHNFCVPAGANYSVAITQIIIQSFKYAKYASQSTLYLLNCTNIKTINTD